MALNCGIIGLANIGKTTIFNCMSSKKAETTSYAFNANKSNIGVINVPDPRLYEINKFIKSDKIIPATVEIIDVPGLVKGSNQGEGVGNQFLAELQKMDALIHVVRCFEDNSLPHIEGSIDPVRDREIVDFELQLRDLELVQRKKQRLEKLVKTGNKQAKTELEIVEVYRKHLENFGNARTAPVRDEDKQVMKDIQLLTDKPVIWVCNVDEASALEGNMYTKMFADSLDPNEEMIMIAGKLEEEIAELENAEDREEFLKDAGLKEPGVDRLIRSAYSKLNLMSFFTAGPKEVRAWTVKKGSLAPKAAGVIHSDLERGFIRTEVMKYEDFLRLGSEQAVKEAGKMHVEGKNYIVEDGDIMHIRFNV